ncbi:MAG: Molybdopterin-synthase adenylyltransferase [uncultured Solirubrobacteraceae bacterium]|uniref:Molybdopterin-synthase adenylyltransferase n=1 Tax=uncultured Solirubrobacteraceae bacterium TaxID=1162706 RepID=A0A6J4S949_9ACTN|nr:MAG: Molybdopterin-synthase adenylyltransferase [uncultured Solirubrobacteraceae bacterium]
MSDDGSSRRRFLRELASAAREVRGAGAAGRDAYAEAEAALLAGEAAPEETVPERPADELTDAELDRYSRQLVLPRWSERIQLALREASVLVVGAGALGSPVALYLAGAGVGRLGIVDSDAVELSNLHRQLLHFSPDVGVAKAHSAAAKLAFLNPEVEVVPYEVRFEAHNAAALLEGHDVVVDGSDSFATRYAVNAACCAARLPLVEGGVLGLSGLVMAIEPGRTACYRCAFPEPPPAGSVPSCAEGGVLGPAAGVVGSLQALEALKLLTGFAPALTDAFLQVELLDPGFTRVAVQRRPGCPDCGAL